ncbi:MAG: helix-turn-helix transcriptional regulator [Planctomycetota bacterium]
MANERTTQTCQLLTAQAVADRLSLSKRAVFRMRSAGLICAPLTVGRGAVRWRLTDIERWIAWGCPTKKDFEAMRQAGGNNDR